MYDAVSDAYCYLGTTVLKNRASIRTQAELDYFEEQATAQRFSEPLPRGKLDSHADMPRQGDRDGRGNLSQRALADFTLWFLQVSLDQVRFMAQLLALDTLAQRLRGYVERSATLKPEAARLLEEALIRGELERGEAPRITGLPERTARRVVNDAIAHGLLASETPKGPLSLRFPGEALDVLFPRLFPET